MHSLWLGQNECELILFVSHIQVEAIVHSQCATAQLMIKRIFLQLGLLLTTNTKLSRSPATETAQRT